MFAGAGTWPACRNVYKNVNMPKKTDQFISVHRLKQQAIELNVLNSELMSLNSSAKVYRQLGSGSVFFLANKASLAKETQGKLLDVQRKLKQAEEGLK